MAVLIDKNTRLIVQGITGREGTFHARQAAAYGTLPTSGKIFVSVANRDKRGMIFPVKRLADLGFEIVATVGTGEVLRRHGIVCEVVGKHSEDAERDAVSLIASGEVKMVINTPLRRVISKGIDAGLNAGISKFSGQPARSQADMTPEEREQARIAKDMARRARQAARLTRKL